MKLSEISRRICTHLTVQKARSAVMDDGHVHCLYRDGHGHMCAVGCLIDDAHYSPDLETLGIGMTRVQKAITGSLGLETPVLDQTQTILLAHWQRYHDCGVGSLSYANWLADPTTGVSPADFHAKMAEQFNFEP